MFKMFVHPVAATTPVTDVYRQHRAYGPYGNRAWDDSVDDAHSGFSPWLSLEIRASAPIRYRELRAVCSGSLRILPTPTPGAPPHIRMVVLEPVPHSARELDYIGKQVGTETTVGFQYDGVDIERLRTRLTPLIETAPNPKSFPLNMRVDAVIDREQPIMVPIDFVFGDVAAITEQNGWLRCGFRAVVADGNLQDPVALFHSMLGRTSRYGSWPLLSAYETTRSWLDVVDRSRVLIELRDEWNRPLISAHRAEVNGVTPDQLVEPMLDAVQHGTLAVPGGWSQYVLEISGTSPRRYNAIRSADAAIPGPVTLNLTAPAHRVFQTFDLDDWFVLRNPMHPTSPGGVTGTELPQFTEGNVAEPLIDGIPYFARLYEDLRLLDDPTPHTGSHPIHFAFFGDWYFDPDVTLRPTVPGTTAYAMLNRAHGSPGSAIVRLLAWGAPNDQNLTAIQEIGSIDGNTALASLTHAIGETVGPAVSAFHWKCNVIRNRKGTVAHVGGIDLHPNRLDIPHHEVGEYGYHDVHLRLHGPATTGVLEALRHRYQLNVAHDFYTDSLATTETTPPGVPATAIVQITRTAPPGPAFDYPTGDRTTWATLSKAIERAKRYIYIEEQYLVSGHLRDKLQAQLLREPELELVIVIPSICDQGIPDIPLPFSDEVIPIAQRQCDRGRFLFVEPLLHHSRVQIFAIERYFVHSKVVVIDDVFATIGSANMNNRGFMSDREINAFVFDGRIENGRRKFAHDLRILLWAEHLGLDLHAPSMARLSNLDEALRRLRRNDKPSRLVPYTAQNPGATYPAGWDYVDPEVTP